MKVLLLGLPVMLMSMVLQDLDGISQAIQTGNARELAKQLDSNVEITIMDKEATYSRAQAEMVLRRFFEDHPPVSFEMIHKGSSKEGSKYGIGQLATKNGGFRTYVFAKAIEDVYLIQEIRFEEE